MVSIRATTPCSAPEKEETDQLRRQLAAGHTRTSVIAWRQSGLFQTTHATPREKDGGTVAPRTPTNARAIETGKNTITRARLRFSSMESHNQCRRRIVEHGLYHSYRPRITPTSTVMECQTPPPTRRVVVSSHERFSMVGGGGF